MGWQSYVVYCYIALSEESDSDQLNFRTHLHSIYYILEPQANAINENLMIETEFNFETHDLRL